MLCTVAKSLFESDIRHLSFLFSMPPVSRPVSSSGSEKGKLIVENVDPSCHSLVLSMS